MAALVEWTNMNMTVIQRSGWSCSGGKKVPVGSVKNFIGGTKWPHFSYQLAKLANRHLSEKEGTQFLLCFALSKSKSK